LCRSWSTSLSNDLGEQAQPLIYDGVMYVTKRQNGTFAIDVANGRQIWRTAVATTTRDAAGSLLRRSNKVAAIYNGKALPGDARRARGRAGMKTGKEYLEVQVRRYGRDGYSPSSPPLIANGVLITGIVRARSSGCADSIGRLGPGTGKQLWRRYTIPGPGEPGFETWPQEPMAVQERRRDDLGDGLVRSAAST
jgi:alcohol dehydrogenase (cytochrome c)